MSADARQVTHLSKDFPGLGRVKGNLCASQEMAARRELGSLSPDLPVVLRIRILDHFKNQISNFNMPGTI